MIGIDNQIKKGGNILVVKRKHIAVIDKIMQQLDHEQKTIKLKNNKCVGNTLFIIS